MSRIGRVFPAVATTTHATVAPPFSPYVLDLISEVESCFPADVSGQVVLGQIVEAENVDAVDSTGSVGVDMIVEAEYVRALQSQVVLSAAIEVERISPVKPRGALVYVPGLPRIPEMRVIAQDILTGAMVHLDVPIAELSLVDTLSGPQQVTGSFEPVLPELLGLGFKPWGTWLHVEDDEGSIRNSAIMTGPFGVEGEKRNVAALGVHGYAQKVSWDGDFSVYSVDPLDVVRLLWGNINQRPNTPLDVTVSNTASNVRIGGYPPTADTGNVGPRVQDGNLVITGTTTDIKPYSLSWWEAPNIGETIDELARDIPFDYLERQWWNDDRTAVQHHVELGYPRVGTLRTDLSFRDGENIRDTIPVRQGDDEWVTDVRLLGAGEGRAMINALWRYTSPGQLPIEIMITDPTVTSTARAASRVQAELKRRAVRFSMESILVDAKHPNAPWGSYQVGDDILVQSEIDWIGPVTMWHRILETTYTPDEEAVAIKLAPSQSFRYGSDD